MRLFALSDVHVDYEANAEWIRGISASDYRDDVLILAGDVAHTLPLLNWCLCTLAGRFRKVLFVPGNHDLWVIGESPDKTSVQKFQDVSAIVESSGASMQSLSVRGVSIVALLGWYDYSFGEPSEELKSTWLDYFACRWPFGFDVKQIVAQFAAQNAKHIVANGDKVITFSHFLPRIDIIPRFISKDLQLLYPVLGTTLLEDQLRRLKSSIHVYGHSHLNRKIAIDGVLYINNAFGYPHETRIASKSLLCVHED